MKIFRNVKWADGVYCPRCKSFKHIVNRWSQGKTKKYSCTSCGNNFSDFTSTPFYNAKISFGKIPYIEISHLIIFEYILIQLVWSFSSDFSFL
jgi:DNA-directed RNA polymerase subunit RPC12/RpoP